MLNTINDFLSICTNNSLIWKIQLDQYEREVERYGVNTIDVAEKIFHIDSLNFIDTLLEIKKPNFNRNDFYYNCVLVIDTYLNVFTKDDIELKLKFCYFQKELFRNEFKSTASFKQQLDKKFRNEKKYLFDFMNQFNTAEESFYLKQYDELRLLNKSFREKLQIEFTLLEKTEKIMNIERYLISYIHMSVIRYCKTNNRMHEYVFYDTLEKYYRYSIGLIKHTKRS